MTSEPSLPTSTRLPSRECRRSSAGYLNGELKPAEAPLALPGNGAAARLRRHRQHGAVRQRRSNCGRWRIEQITMAPMEICSRSRAAPQGSPQRYPAPPLVAAGEEMISTAADEFQLLAFKLRSWAAQRRRQGIRRCERGRRRGKEFCRAEPGGRAGSIGQRHSLDRRRYPRAISALCLSGAESGRTARISAGNHGIRFHHNSDARARPEPDAVGRNQQPRAGISGFGQNGPVDRDGEGAAAAYQYIIIDTPPALLVPDAQILATARRWHNHRDGRRQHRTRRDHQDVSDVRSRRICSAWC